MTITNEDRTEWAAAALRHYQGHNGSIDQDSLHDLLRDLMRLAHARKLDFEAALGRATRAYAQKTRPIPYMATFNTPAGRRSTRKPQADAA